MTRVRCGPPPGGPHRADFPATSLWHHERMDFVGVLTEFGATARLGGIRPLDNLADIAERLGPFEKSGRINPKRRWPHWFGYGDVTFESCHCRVVNRLSLRTWYESVRIPAEAPGEFRTFPTGVRFDRLAGAFAGAGLGWEELRRSEREFAFATEVAELPGAAVSFTFTADDRLLYSVHATASGHLCRPPEPGAPDDGFGR
ncbi:hypothetical protein [Kitasatospora sp. NPDC018619]|uniref:hypothetical protein n=1 Tax=unclassified Kitasatospora TaxID=2633591 RepID=UPI0037BE1EF9